MPKIEEYICSKSLLLLVHRIQNFWRISTSQIHLFLEAFADTAKLFLLGWDNDMTSQWEHLLERPLAFSTIIEALQQLRQQV